MRKAAPKVLVLLAAYQGAPFVEQQILSVLGQHGVEPHILVSVDLSTDDTERLIDQCCASSPQITTLAHGQTFGGAAPNFYRLLCEADLRAYEYIALADQDDVWLPDKLARAVATLEEERVDGYSSNVWEWRETPSPKMSVIVKSQPQQRWDHLFSSPGPGCTFVLKREPAIEFADWLREISAAQLIDYHDWLIYAWFRVSGYRWTIDDQPTMLYRQHGGNQLGANSGIAAVRDRVAKVRSDWYLSQVRMLAKVLKQDDARPIQLLTDRSIVSRVKLGLLARSLRRSRRETMYMWALLLLAPRRDVDP